jgi:protein tyrosine phosphatase (PTP) superfamily phosphohydrolase (DUF442 family)
MNPANFEICWPCGVELQADIIWIARANLDNLYSSVKIMLIRSLYCWLAGAMLVLADPALTGAPTEMRPAGWAAAVELDGVPNLHKISPNLYRSAQPSAIGMQNLKKKGIVTVVNLRSFSSDRDEIGNTGLGYEHIYMKAWNPERKEVVRFLQIVTDPKRQPVLLHCKHGADRTGTMCAVYRIAIQGWTKEEAIREMTKGNYGFHTIWKNLPEWIEELDIDAIKKEAFSSVK